MKKLFLFVALIVATTLTFGQKSNLTYSVGAVALFPITNSVDTKTPSFGETVKITSQQFGKLGYTLSGTYLQNKANAVQIPVLLGVKAYLLKNVSLGVEAGASFYNHRGTTQFTYSPSVSVRLGKLSVEQKFLSSLDKDGKATSSVGVGIVYHLN